jgi:hypothetical protein
MIPSFCYTENPEMITLDFGHDHVLQDDAPPKVGASDTALNNDKTVLETEFAAADFQLTLRDFNASSSIFSGKFNMLLEGREVMGDFDVINRRQTENTEGYIKIKANLYDWNAPEGKRRLFSLEADSNETDDYGVRKTDWHHKAYSVEMALPGDPGIACLKIVDRKDKIAGLIVFYEDGKIHTENINLLNT